MSDRHTVVRSLHDVGLAAWFGGSLMGATGLNGAASEATDPKERISLATAGWAKWTPWSAIAIAAHTVGGVGLIAANRKRIQKQPGVASVSVVKFLLTASAVGTTAYSGALGLKVKQHQNEGAAGATQPRSGRVSDDLASAQRQLKLMQWATPVLTGILVVLGAVQGEQQRGLGGLIGLGAGEVVRSLKQAKRAA